MLFRVRCFRLVCPIFLMPSALRGIASFARYMRHPKLVLRPGRNALCPSTPLDLATPLLRALGAFLRASLSHTGPSCEKLCSSSRSTIEIKTRGELLPGFLLPRCLVWSDYSQQA